MALQKVVGASFAPAVPGMPAVVEENHYTAVTLISSKPVTVGHFVFAAAAKASTHVDPSTTSGLPRGIVAFSRNYSGTFEPTMEVSKGQPLEIITTGKVWMKADNQSAAPKVGDFVYAMKADGTIQTSLTNITEGIPTNFVVTYVENDSDNKSMVIISNETATGKAVPA